MDLASIPTSPVDSSAVLPLEAYHATETDYYDVLRFFSCVVPVEIAEQFLQEAQYWARVEIRTGDELVVTASDYHGLFLDVIFLLSMPVPEGGNGSYRWAWSWFEASIVRDHREIEVDGQTRWLVQRNLRAVRSRKQHTVFWTPHASPEAPPTTPGEQNKEPIEQEGEYKPPFSDENVELGNGFGDRLVEVLQPGDRIALHARAWKHAWQNKVKSASIEILYTPL